MKCKIQTNLLISFVVINFIFTAIFPQVLVAQERGSKDQITTKADSIDSLDKKSGFQIKDKKPSKIKNAELTIDALLGNEGKKDKDVDAVQEWTCPEKVDS